MFIVAAITVAFVVPAAMLDVFVPALFVGAFTAVCTFAVHIIDVTGIIVVVTIIIAPESSF